MKSLVHPEPPGMLVVVAESCNSWNRGHCTAAFLCAGLLVIAVCALDLIVLLLALRTPSITRGRTGSDRPSSSSSA